MKKDTGKSLKNLTKAEVLSKLGISDSTLKNRIKAGFLPKSFSHGGRRVYWFESEIDEITKARVAGKNDAQVKQIVKRQLKDREASFQDLEAA